MPACIDTLKSTTVAVIVTAVTFITTIDAIFSTRTLIKHTSGQKMGQAQNDKI